MNKTIKANFYIDGNFAYHYYKHLHSAGRTINWNALKTYILDKIEKKEGGEAIFDQCHYFMGISSQQEELERKLFKTSLADSGFSQICKEDAIDTTLVLTAQEEAFSTGYEYAILFAADSNLAPLPYFLNKKGIKTILVYCDIENDNGVVGTKTSIKLQQECFDNIYLNNLLKEELHQIANLQRRALLVNFDFPDLLERLIFPQIKQSGNQPIAENIPNHSTNQEQKNSSSFTPISAKNDFATKTVESEEEDWFGDETPKPKVSSIEQTEKNSSDPKVLARRKGIISNIIANNRNKSIFIHTSDIYGDFYVQMPDDWNGQINDKVEFDVARDYNPTGSTNFEKNGLACNIVIIGHAPAIEATKTKHVVSQSAAPAPRIPSYNEICTAIQQLQAQKDSEGYVYVNEVGNRLNAIMGCPVAGILKDVIIQYPDLFETQDQPAYRIRNRKQKTHMHGQVSKADPEILARVERAKQQLIASQKTPNCLIKPTDWAEANGIKWDVTMKLLREAGVSVRTHMSRVDACDYDKIIETTALEIEKQNAPMRAQVSKADPEILAQVERGQQQLLIATQKTPNNQIKPTDWAEANGIKVDVVMKLLRDVGVTVRTHMSKVDAQDYEKIKEAVALEKEKQNARNANHGKSQGFFSGIFQSLQKSSPKRPVVWLDETLDECVSCGACEAICDAVFSVPEKMHVNENVNYLAYREDIEDAAANCPAGVIRYNFS